ncbi:rRNA maturation RNase YbeY [uncultured Campylobacter sp.]|uniref:rRNA maturation RNase YbeY n=1 Tax=uncultured Campylobacter sp. TaxID=218934 RepID=UPI00261004BE|nr:rRNA maturation RNase YbeY [uncultured Campylobacter sp.]
MLSFPLDPAAFAGFGEDLSEENSAHENSGAKILNDTNSASKNTDAANSASKNSNAINSKNSEGENPNDENLKNENFDGGNFAPALLGSVVINLDLVELKAAQLGHGRDDETALLFTHGMLHVLGYDHESDDGQMRAKECEIIKKFRLPKSLIVRTEGSEE